MIFLDINSEFFMQGDGTQILLEDELAILNSILNLLNINLGECYRQLGKGSNLNTLLFDPINDNTAFSIEIELINILRWETRCTINRALTIVTPDYDNQQYTAQIGIHIPYINKDVLFPLILNRTS